MGNFHPFSIAMLVYLISRLRTPVVSAVPAPVPAPLVVPVPAVLEPETSSATDAVVDM